MSNENFTLKIIGERELQSALKRIAGRAEDAEPAMSAISMVLLRETERIFEQEGRGVGLDQEWAPLSEVTKHRRALAASDGRQFGKRGKELKRYSAAMAPGGMKILQASGLLAGSMTATSTSHSAALTTNREYAAAMFFGAKKGELGSGTDKRGRPFKSPWGDLPGRVFLPLRDIREDSATLTERPQRSMLDILRRHFEL